MTLMFDLGAICGLTLPVTLELALLYNYNKKNCETQIPRNQAAIHKGETRIFPQETIRNQAAEP